MTVGFQATRTGANDGRDVFHSDCPAREVLDHITSRWGILVLIALKDGALRFYRLRDRIDGISEKMLSQNLRILARDGLIERSVKPTVPPEVSYGLTPLGRQAVVLLCGVTDWIAQHAEEIKRTQQRYDAHGDGPA
jgi:DNA-binding HxlR family transcriptional regulator